MTYPFRPDGELDQGDLLRRVVVCGKPPVDVNAKADVILSHVCVLSHGCDTDKPRFDTVLIARLIRLSAVPDAAMAGNIRRNRAY